jgi:hypothetical protein
MAVDETPIELLMRMLDTLYRDGGRVSRLQIIQAAETMSLPEDILGIINLLPPGEYTRARVADQLNSAIVGHGMGRTFGTVE